MLSASEEPSIWQADVALAAPYRDWLVSDRLMTPDIRRSFEAPVRIDVLAEGDRRLPTEVVALAGTVQSDGWLRQVAIHAGPALLVLASCWAPSATITRHSWLRQLGDRPLGGELAERDDVTRVAKHFCRTEQLADVDASRLPGAWSRRSLFAIGATPLVLFEHLSPIFATVERRTGR